MMRLQHAGFSSPLPGLRWAVLLGFALVAPISLPAGGSDRRQPELRRRASGEPLLCGTRAELKVAPNRRAPALVNVWSDEPLHILRRWHDRRGVRWLMVEKAVGPLDRRRGWLMLEPMS